MTWFKNNSQFGIDLSLTNSALVEVWAVTIFVLLLKLKLPVDGGLLVPTH